MRSRWLGRLFWLALIGVLIVPSSAPPEPVHRELATGALPFPWTVYIAVPEIVVHADGLPTCGRSEAHVTFSCLRPEDLTPRRATMRPTMPTRHGPRPLRSSGC